MVVLQEVSALLTLAQVGPDDQWQWCPILSDLCHCKVDHGSPDESSSKSSSDLSEEDEATLASQYAALTGLEPTQEMAVDEIRNQSSPSGNASEVRVLGACFR